MKPLLIIDGDSFAHRSYHALPKSTRRAGGRPAGLLVGVGNLVVRLWEEESPRAVLVAWDTLTVPTYRHLALESYQSGREFDRDLLEQLDLAPQLVEAMGFAVAKADGYEADDFLAAAVAFEEARGGTALVASGDRDTFQLASEQTTILQPQRGGGALTRIGPAEVRERYGVEPKQVPDFIALRGDPSDRIPGRPRRRRRRRLPTCSGDTKASRPYSPRGVSPPRRTRSGFTAGSRRWMPTRRCRHSRSRSRRGRRGLRWRRSGG